MLFDRLETEKLHKRAGRAAKRMKHERGQVFLFYSSSSAQNNTHTYSDGDGDEESTFKLEDGSSADAVRRGVVDDDVTLPLGFTRSQSH